MHCIDNMDLNNTIYFIVLFIFTSKNNSKFCKWCDEGYSTLNFTTVHS